MSSYDQQSQAIETQQQVEKGEGVFLAPQERAALARMMGHPEDLPPDFKEWMIDFMAVNIPQIPVGQIVGFEKYTRTVEAVQAAQVVTNAALAAQDAAIIAAQIETNTAEVGTQNNTTSTTYIDLGTSGPEIINLRSGSYLLYFGALVWDTASVNAYMSVSVNGSTPVNSDGCTGSTPSGMSIARVVKKNLPLATTNSVACKYKVNGGTGYFEARWLVAQRTGPAV